MQFPGGSSSYESVTRGGVVRSDVGYIVRTENPFSSSHRVVLIGGAHTYGTVAAARWWVEHGRERTLPVDAAVLVEAEVVPGDHVAPPQMLHMAPLL